VFGPLLGLLLFCYLVSRFALLVSAWAATTRGNELPAAPEPALPAPAELGPAHARPGSEPVPPPAAVPVPTPVPVVPPAPTSPSAVRAVSHGALGAALGVGVLLGAWLRGPRRSRDPAP
jgi:hypothetical protein